jgi:bifunctional non-homologous end joining protein LigD
MRPFPGRRHVPLEDPIVEPLWSGVRILAHVSASRAGGMAPVVRLVEEVGADLAPELPELAAALGAGVDADEAVIDGLVTRQVGLEGVGAAAIPEIRASGSRLLLGGAGELDIRPRGRAAEGASSAREGFVAVDLLRLDGITLLDVPLLERKRLLESVMRPGDLVRISVHTRPPYETWVATWKALGLRGGILKAANSHYRPGARSPEWRIVETVGRRGR